ncbi:purine nucleosidase [Brevibacterium sp. 239c]|uniref:nucleoside hydrolase n=1 Tax=Brevibacterium sp. 239c TaxID=1965356 RepID=UPI000C552032|nr:nucleoside hydrolase [Brevibacterium sp. 239c]SMX67841.1 purine nucleosidase [Brevibacterium sp. 239c]
MTTPIYFDCDTGVDDAMALGLLLASAEVDLVGIGGVHGNVSAAQGVENTLRLLSLAGCEEIPVAVGENDPLCGDFGGGVPHIHGSNGLGGIALPAAAATPVEEDAADMLVRLSHEYAGDLKIVAVGPLTNLGTALQRDPSVAERIASVTLMGGAALAPGNITAVAEANIANDAEAAQAVVSAPWSVTIVPLDATMTNLFEESDRQQLLAAESEFVHCLGQILDRYFDFYVGEFGRRCSALHDPLAVAIAIGAVAPGKAPRVPVIIDTSDGPGRGQTICDLRGRRPDQVDRDGANVRVVLDTQDQLAPVLIDQLLSFGRKLVAQGGVGS